MGHGTIPAIATPAKAHTNWCDASCEFHIRCRVKHCREYSNTTAAGIVVASAAESPADAAAARQLRASPPFGALAAVGATDILGAQGIGVDDVRQRPEPAATAAATVRHVVSFAHAEVAPVALFAASQVAARPREPSPGGRTAATEANHGRRLLGRPVAARARLIL